MGKGRREAGGRNEDRVRREGERENVLFGFCQLNVRNNRFYSFRGERDDLGWTDQGRELDFDD